MSDSRQLLEGIRQYQNSLRMHSDVLNSEFQILEKRWQSFNIVSEGDYVNQFRVGWGETCSQFRNYMDQSQNILSLLDERIESLSEFDRGQEDGYTLESLSPSLGTHIQDYDKTECASDIPINSDTHTWNLDKENIENIAKFRSEIDRTKKTILSQYLGEEYGHKMLTEILGYSTYLPGYGVLLDPIEKYDSFPQGFDGVYFDPSTDEIVVAEFKGQRSELSNIQEMSYYVSSVCQKIINGNGFPYRNAPSSEYNLACEIKKRLNENTVRFEVYRTFLDTKSGTLSTNLERRIFPDMIDTILSSSKIVQSKSKQVNYEGIVDNPEIYQRIQELISRTKDFTLPVNIREETHCLLSNELIRIAKQSYDSGALTTSQKKRLTGN